MKGEPTMEVIGIFKWTLYSFFIIIFTYFPDQEVELIHVGSVTLWQNSVLTGGLTIASLI